MDVQDAMKNIFCRKRKRQAFTLTEIAIVLGITGLILGAVWVAASKVRLTGQIHTASQQLAAIAQNTRTVFTEQGGVTGNKTSNLNASLDQLKVFPLEMRQSQSNPQGIIFHPWYQQTSSNGGFTVGSVQIYADDCTGTENNAATQPCFGIHFTFIPQDICIQLLLQTGQNSSGLQQIHVNSSTVMDLASSPPPILVSKALASCDNTNGSGSNDILWVYLLKDNKT